MKVYFDHKFHQWCAEESNGSQVSAAWGDTKEEAIERFKKNNS
jgi:hypothetical protein